MDAQGILIMIPAYNEEQALPGVLHELAAVVPECDVLVIDDGSTDRTAEVAREAGAVVAALPFNLGVGGALRTGFRYAQRYGYQRAVQFDGDGQHDATEISSLLEGLARGNDVVIGSRFAGQRHEYVTGRTRGGAMGFLRLVVRVLSGRRFTDTSSGFRAFGPRSIDLFARTYPIEYLGDTVEALLLAVYEGLDVAEVPTRMRMRAGGVPSNRNVRLVLHYVRLLLMLVLTASPRSRRLGRVMS